MTTPTQATAPTRRRVRLVADTKGATRTVPAGSLGWGEPIYPDAALLVVTFDRGARLVLGPDQLEFMPPATVAGAIGG